MEVMTDPFVGNDGHTYERCAITQWLANHQISPLTRQPMTIADIKPNYALRNAMERWILTNEPFPNSAKPFNNIPSIKKKHTITSTKIGDSMVLEIGTTHSEPMETILIAVLDVSCSMEDSASNNLNFESDQFSRLDLVKHSMKTLAALLNAQYDKTKSSLSIITFSTNAKVVMPITKMDNIGLQNANIAIKKLRTESSTNIWDGLRLGLQQAQIAIHNNPNANIQILLLTDGEPSYDLIPPLGIYKMLDRAMNQLQGRVTISTFGFGYNLDTTLLESICVLGNGTYGFIPDCSMVGTVFINWASKALLTLSHHISIKLPNDQEYNIGDIIVGHKQKLLLPILDLNTVEITFDNDNKSNIQIEENLGPIDEHIETHVNAIYLNRLISEIEKLKNNKDWSNINDKALLILKTEIDDSENTTEFMKDISRDIKSEDINEGQIMKAISKEEWWSSWGINHCLSYYYALKLQQCVNFKDKALQHFASKAFKELQDKGIDIFSNLPVPEPSIRSYRYIDNISDDINTVYRGVRSNKSNSSFIQSMASYVTNSGPCFLGSCKIKMKDGNYIYVEDLKKGNIVWGGHKILAVLITQVNKEVDMVSFQSGLKITPWHPMKLYKNSDWVFPNDVGVTKKMFVDNYYNLVLETGHIVKLNGYLVVTLGHGFTDNEVISHQYFGTQAVIDDLKNHPDWNRGLLFINPENIIRDEKTGLVVKYNALLLKGHKTILRKKQKKEIKSKL